jgi:hypothetical protein
LDALDIVNYRAMTSVHGPKEGSIAEQVNALADLKTRGLVRHFGPSNVAFSDSYPFGPRKRGHVSDFSSALKAVAANFRPNISNLSLFIFSCQLCC